MDREAVLGALQRRYPTHGIDAIPQDELISLLCDLPEGSLTGNATLLEVIGQAASGISLSKDDFAVLSFVDDSCKMIFQLTGLETEIEQQLRNAMPVLAVSLMQEPEIALPREAASIISVLDLICEAALGWHSDLGKQGDTLYQKIVESIGQLIAGWNPGNSESLDFEAIVTELDGFFSKEKQRVRKLEERLRQSEAGTLRARTAKTVATRMINDAIRGKQFPAAISEFLTGPWYNSVQLLLIQQGEDSDTWRQAEKLTETIVWTMQPLAAEGEALEQEKQKLYRIIEHLPEEIRQLLVALEHQADTAEEFLDALEEEHLKVAAGFDLEYEDFELLQEEHQGEPVPAVSGLLLRKIRNLEEDDWFVFEPEPDQISRVKLALKLDDVRQMLFTNRNGMRTLTGSYDEVAYLLTRGVLKRLTVEAGFASTFNNYLSGLVSEHSRRKEIEDAQAQADREAQERESAKQKALEEARALEQAQEEAERAKQEADFKADMMRKAAEAAENPENAERLAVLTETVNHLQIGAWLELPAVDGVATECKLAVRISSADKMIFVTRSGMKVGEYSSEELIQLLISEQGRIINEGVEFEDTLAKVVSGLRENREMSFDDLTGSGEEEPA